MESHLHWADYLILVAFLVISLGIGIYHSLTGGRQKTIAEFIMGNRQLKVIPTSISLLVSIVSALLLLGTTAETYSYGIQLIVFYIVSVTVALLFVERIIVPWLYPLKLVSVYDYLEMRFMSKSIRIFGAMLGVVTLILFMGVSMYAPSAALESATGLPLAVSIPCMAVVAVTYTALGGMRAVIWTDVFQFFIMIFGMIAIVVKGLIVVGGISNVFRLAEKEGRLIWARTILLIIPPVVIMDAMAGVIALIVLAYYSRIKCDPMVNGDISNLNMMLPHFVVTIFADTPGFAGIFLAALYGATLSSLSSSLSGSAANCWEDVLKWKLSHLSEERKTLINKILVVLFGVLITGMAFVSAWIPGPIIQVMIALYSSTVGPMVGIFFLGGISKHANWQGTLMGGTAGVLLTLWLSIGSMTIHHKHPSLPSLSVEHCSLGNSNSTFLTSTLNDYNFSLSEISDGLWTKNWNQTTEAVPDSKSHVTTFRGLENLYAISYLWFIPIGVIITVVFGMLASFITRNRELEANVDDRLLMRFRSGGWSDGTEVQEHMENGNKASLQEAKDMEMTESRKTEKRFIKEIQIDSKQETDL